MVFVDTVLIRGSDDQTDGTIDESRRSGTLYIHGDYRDRGPRKYWGSLLEGVFFRTDGSRHVSAALERLDQGEHSDVEVVTVTIFPTEGEPSTLEVEVPLAGLVSEGDVANAETEKTVG